jgi:hypothetical protein
LKFYIGKALQLGLEFLVATFLSWSITVETEGRWPWQVGTDGKA